MAETNRQAIDTIRGYLYQFDNTILQILDHEDETSSFTVEGIEDIDVEQIGNETIAIQCKYYEKSNFTPSIIKEAISWMVKDFSKRIHENKDLIRYKLFGHYKSGQEKLIQPISVDYLKDNLLTTKTKEKDDKLSVETKVHIDLGLDDEKLKQFLSKLTLEIDGPTLDQQHSDIIEKLIDFNICERGDADFFYAKSIYIIRNLAKNPLENKRKITKKEFVQQLKNSKKMIFDFWYVEKVSIEKYSKSIRKKYFNNTQSKFNRFFMIEANNVNFQELKNLLKELSMRWSNLSGVNQINRFCPFVYLHNIDSQKLINLKEELILDGYLVEDGYYYHGSKFDAKLILRDVVEHKSPYRTHLKLINDLEDYEILKNESIPNKYIYQFYFKEPFIDIDESYDIYIKDLECLRGMVGGR